MPPRWVGYHHVYVLYLVLEVIYYRIDFLPQCGRSRRPGLATRCHQLTHSDFLIAGRLAGMKGKRRNRREKYLQDLAAGLHQLRPDLSDTFMCPICLELIPLARTRDISDAHIVPRSGGGRTTTFLCRACNSGTGARQDKWFGEFVHLSTRANRNILKTRVPPKYFTIDGTRVHGAFNVTPENNFELIYDASRNPPDVTRMMLEKFDKSPKRLEIGLPLPVLKVDAYEVELGYLTAGYLMWFRALGYSWVLQRHLDAVRHAIRNPDQKLDFNFPRIQDKSGWNGWVGIVKGNKGEMMPAFALLDRMVLFPPADSPVAALPREDNLRVTARPLYRFPSTRLALGLIFENRVMVLPDPFFERPESAKFIYYAPDEEAPRILGYVNEEEANRMKSDPRVRHTRIGDYRP